MTKIYVSCEASFISQKQGHQIGKQILRQVQPQDFRRSVLIFYLSRVRVSQEWCASKAVYKNYCIYETQMQAQVEFIKSCVCLLQKSNCLNIEKGNSYKIKVIMIYCCRKIL